MQYTNMQGKRLTAQTLVPKCSSVTITFNLYENTAQIGGDLDLRLLFRRTGT